MAWLFWPVLVAVMSRIGCYLLYEVAVLARIVGRYEPCWPLFAAWSGCSGPCRWPMSRIGRYLRHDVAALARVGGHGPGGHTCLSAVMPASAASQHPWRRTNTARTLFCRRTQGAGAKGESLRCWGFAQRAAPRGPRAQPRLLAW